MAEKLMRLMGTQYITDDHAGKLTDTLEKLTEVDLSGCKFTPAACSVLKKFYPVVSMCDSGNSTRNSILVHNNKAVRCNEPEMKLLPTDVKTPEDALALFRGIDRTRVYKLDTENCRTNKSKAFIIAFLMKFPEVQVDLGFYAKDIFSTVRREWLLYAEHHDAYWRVEGSAIVKIDCVEGKMQDLDGREINEDIYVHEFVVLPYEFGTMDVTEHSEFKAAWMSALKVIMKVETSKKHMIDYIDFA